MQIPVQDPLLGETHWRVRTLATILAGMTWPGGDKFEKLPKAQRRKAMAVAAKTLAEMKATD